MEENVAMTTESQEVMTDADFDAGWSDDDTADVGVDQPDEEVAEQPAEEEQKAEPKEEPTEKAEDTVPVEQEPQRFALKNKVTGDKWVTLEEMKALAQKGDDYDRVQQERDQLRNYWKESEPAMALVRKAAEKSGFATIGEYLDYVRKQELMQTGINEQTAQAQIAMEKQKAEMDAILEQQRKEKDAEAQVKAENERRMEARRAEINAFRQNYPDVKAEAIPREVWDMVKNGTPLVAAYSMHRMKALETELAAARQNKAAREQSPGSMKTAGDQTKDIYDDGWYDD
jgi:hypothetical protein